MSALLQHQLISTRPHLYLLSSGSAPMASLSPAVYRRRRVAALVLSVFVVFMLWFVLQFLVGVVAGDSQAGKMQTISATHPVSSEADQYWTVRPGDTLWSIAQAVHPKGDIRPILDRLRERYGSTPLFVGQNIIVL